MFTLLYTLFLFLLHKGYVYYIENKNSELKLENAELKELIDTTASKTITSQIIESLRSKGMDIVTRSERNGQISVTLVNGEIVKAKVVENDYSRGLVKLLTIGL